MITRLEEYVKEKCNSPENRFQPEFYNSHLFIMKSYALQLADKLGADKTVVEISALLHDISAITNFSKLAVHDIESASMAAEILREYPLSPEQKDKIGICIKTHSKPLDLNKGIIEAVCISNADAMSQIAVPSYWLFYIFSVRKFNYTEGIEWYMQRVESHWKSLIEPAKEIIKAEYLYTTGLFTKNG